MMKRLNVLIIIAVIVFLFLVIIKGDDCAKIISKSDELLDLGEIEAARALLEKGIVDYPESAALHAKLGAIYFEIYDASTGIPAEEDIFSHYEKAVELEPDNDAVLSRLGFIYYWFGKWDKSEKSCKQAIELNQDNLKAWRTLGLTYCAFRNVNKKGEKVYKKMIELFPDKAAGYLRLGVLYGKLDKPTESLPMYLKAVDVEPKNLYAIDLLFNFFNDQEWREERDAIAHLGLQTKPDDLLSMKECYYKGAYYKHLEMWDAAKKLYQMALKKYPRKNSYREYVEYELNDIPLEKELIEWNRTRRAEFNNQTKPIRENPLFKHRREILASEREEILTIWNKWKKKQNI